MKVLFICTREPDINGSADQITTFKAIEHLQAIGAEVNLIVGNVSEERDLRFYLNIILKLISGVFSGVPVQVGLYANSSLRKEVGVQVECGEYDIVYVHLIRGLAMVPRRLWSKVHLGMQISQYLNLSRVATYNRHTLVGMFYWLEARLCRVFERRAIKMCFRTNFVAEADFRILDLQHVRIEKLSFVAHGIDAGDYDALPVEKRYDYIFLANFSTETNQNALRFLLNDVWPKIRMVEPSTTLAIAGRGLNLDSHKPTAEGITFLGEVTNAIETTREAWVSLNPVRASAGMQNKVLTALAANCHVVATRVSVEGMSIPDELVSRVSTSSVDLAEAAIIALGQAKSSSGNERQDYVRKNWGWDSLHKRWVNEFLLR